MKETLRKKMISLWAKDYTDELVAMESGMSIEDLRMLLDEDEGLAKERKKALCHLRMKVRDNIASEIEDGEIKTTKWYAERRESEIYSPKGNVTVTGQVEIPLAEKKQMIDELMRDYE